MVSAIVFFAALAFSPPIQVRAPEGSPFSGAVPLDGNHEILVTVRLVDSGYDQHHYQTLLCENRCNGNVHLFHGQCDTSCDTVCEYEHSVTVNYWMSLMFQNETGDMKMSDALANFGSSMTKFEVGNRIMNVADPKLVTNKDALAVTIRKDHFNSAPCSFSSAIPLLRHFDAIADWTLRRVTMIDGKPVYTTGPKGSMILARYGIPQRRTSDLSRELCRCNWKQAMLPNYDLGTVATGTVVQTDPTTTGAEIGMVASDAPVVPAIYSPIIVNPADPMLFTEPGIKHLAFGAICEDMNTGQLTCDNPFATDLLCTLNPGCTLDTDADNVQDVVISRKYECKIAAKGEAERRGPFIEQGAQAGFRLLCMEMNKREPDPKVKYRVMLSYDPVLVRIVSLPAPRFGSALPQARVWIYTDAGTYEQISKKLMFPRLQQKDYVIAAHDTHIAGADLSKLKYNGCFEPSVLAGIVDRRSALKWYASELIRRDAKKLLQWAEKKDFLTEAIASDQNGEIFAHIARLTTVLAASDNAEAQMAALAILKNLPALSKAKLAKEELGASYALVLSRHAKVVAAAEEVSKLYRN